MSYMRLMRAVNKTPSTLTGPLISQYYFGDKLVYHITDETLAKLMYPVAKQDALSETELGYLRFITVDSKKKAVFILHYANYNYSSNLMYSAHKKAFFMSLIDLVEKFCTTLSTSETKVYMNYYNLFRSYILNPVTNISSSVLMSTRLEPVTSSYDEIYDTVDYILSYWHSLYCLDDICYAFKDTSAKGWYAWLQKGICIDSKSNIPIALLANIFNYALDPSSITDIDELFKFNQHLIELGTSEKSFIFNDKLLDKHLTCKIQTTNYNIYKGNSGNIFFKVNNENTLSSTQKIMDMLSHKNLLTNTDMLYSVTGDVYLLFTPLTNKTYNLKKYIRKFPQHFSMLIQKIDACFYPYSELRNLRFRKGPDLLNCICYMEEKKSAIRFSNLSNISLNDEDASVSFDYALLIMMAIAYYMKCNSIDVNNIYSCEFVKILHPQFTSSLINYLNTGEYVFDSSKYRAVLLDSSFSSNIEFVENLSLDDTYTLSKLQFFNDVELPEDLDIVLHEQNKLDAACGYIPFDTNFKLVSNNLDMPTMEAIFSYSKDTSDYYLVPEKIIISKEINCDGTYKIIGVQWNNGKLLQFIDVISNRLINCKDAYKFIAYVLYVYMKDGHKISSDIFNLYINMYNHNPVFTIGSYYKCLFSEQRDLNTYYDEIIAILKSNTDFHTGYDVFSFNELVPNFKKKSRHSQFDSFLYSAVSMIPCDIHPHWHLSDHMCPTCAKSFLFEKDNQSYTVMYQDDVATFYSSSKLSVVYKSELLMDNISQIKTGIENNVFSKFCGLIPEKILVPSYDGYKNGEVWGIKYSHCDLNSMIDLSTFKHIQRLKVVLVMYKKILPHILDGSFICTNPKIFTTMVMHKNFKGEILIPNLTLLECDMIVNKSSATRSDRIQETIKTFAKFLINYIMADEYMCNMVRSSSTYFMNVIRDISQLKFTEDVVRKCLDFYCNYCLTHMLPFSFKHNVCPICKKDGITASKIIFKGKTFFDDLERSSPVNDGGEANIYCNRSGDEAIKIFKSHVDLKFKSKILAKALEKNSLIKKFNEENRDIKIISAQNLLYMKEGNVIQLKGFTQKFIEGSYKISSLKDKEFVKEHGYRRKDVVEILIKACKGIEFLHSIGGFIGDLNGGNILIKGTEVYIIDIDGMSFDDVKNCVYTNTYIYPPSAENNNITMQDDWYSLAVQAFYYLTYSHPFRGVCDNSKVPQNEIDRMKLGLSVLGNHDILPPCISIGWDFLPKNLLNYFINTFEGSKRESMLEILQSYHSYLTKISSMFVEIRRNHTAVININEHTYIDSESNLWYKENKLAVIQDIISIAIRGNDILFGSQGYTYFFNSKTENVYKLNKTYDSVSVYDGNIYYTSEDRRSLLVDVIKTDPLNISTHVIDKPSTYPIVALCVVGDNKFVFIENNRSNNCYDIYCNSKKVHSVKCSNIMTASIVYDELCKKWLALFKTDSFAFGVVIGSDGIDISEFTLPENISKSVSFYGNVLYYVEDEKICCYSLTTKLLRTIDCEHVKNNSLIQRYDNKFVITNPTSIYMYRKDKS